MDESNLKNKLNILYEDNHVIVVEKFVNVLSQKDITNDIDMHTLVKTYIKEKYNKPGNVYLGLLHRLDRMVGGIMVFAKTSKAASRLSEQIKKRSIIKKYLLIANGIFEYKEGTLKNYLKKLENNTSIVANINDGKEAILKYKVLKEDKKNNLSFVEVELLTGRHHQIRVQFANINHSLYGDYKYGKKEKNDLALYSYYLEFVHPTTKKILTFTLMPRDNIWKIFI